MISNSEVFILAVGTIFSVFFAASVLFHTRRAYSSWAKLASVFACLAGLTWGALGFFLMQPRNPEITRHTYSVLLAFEHICGGLCLGFILSILLARPYQKKSDVSSTPTV